MQITIKDYEEWLKNDKKAKVAKKGESLSAFDEQENRALYNQYVNEANLYNQRIESERQLDEQKSSALRDHYVSSEKAEKKAEDIARMQGITTGASQSDLIDLYAKGAAARAAIINENNAQRNDLLSKYNQALAESKTGTNTAIGDIAVKRLEEETRLREEQKKQNQSDFTSYLNQYLAGTIDKPTLDGYYEKLYGDLDESTKNTYFDIDNQRADAKLAAAIENYGNKLIDYDELLKAYEEAGEYVDTDVMGYLDSEKRKKFNDAIEAHKNGEIGYDELMNEYNSLEDSVKKSNKSAIDLARVDHEYKRFSTGEISGTEFVYTLKQADLSDDAKQRMIDYISQTSGMESGYAVWALWSLGYISKEAAKRMINSNEELADYEKKGFSETMIK